MVKERIRVLVVDDSALMRRVVWGLLEQDPELLVVGSAVDGIDAVAKVHQLKPDVVTLDVEMPRMDGLQVLGYLMSEAPVACVMLSAYTPRGAETTLKALDYGAADFVQKPSGTISLNLERVQEELIAKVKTAAGIDLKRLSFHSRPEEPKAPEKAAEEPRDNGGIVAICSSTGGPRALAEVLAGLPGNLACPVAVVQHMSPGFTRSLAERLDKECRLRVQEAAQGDRLMPGRIWLAPGDFHMTLERRGGDVVVALDRRPPQLGVRPCADLLFQSVAEAFGAKAVAVVLTGMGRDGAKGVKAIKARGGRVISQDEATSVVYGMPRAAFATGCVDKVAPLGAVAASIVEWM
jgi:two-component system chemotaxis response regulator CheB